MINSVAANINAGFSMTGQAGPAITINNFPPHTPTAGLSPYTDEEIMRKLKALAKREVAAGNYAWSPTSATEPGSANNEEFRRLMTYFQSNIAPDRVAAINNQLNSMSVGLNISAIMRNNHNMNLFDVIMRSLGKNGKNPNVGVNFINFTDGSPNGLPVAMYTQDGGLRGIFREEDGDLQRGGEFRMKFIEMKTEIKSREGNTDGLIDLKRNGHQADLSLWADKGQAFNVERLAANGITFDSETGQTVVNRDILGGQPTPKLQQQMANNHGPPLQVVV